MTRDEKIDMCIDTAEHLVKWCKDRKSCVGCPFVEFHGLCMIEFVNQIGGKVKDGYYV